MHSFECHNFSQEINSFIVIFNYVIFISFSRCLISLLSITWCFFLSDILGGDSDDDSDASGEGSGDDDDEDDDDDDEENIKENAEGGMTIEMNCLIL